MFPANLIPKVSHKRVFRKTWQHCPFFVDSETQHKSCSDFSRRSVYSTYLMLSRCRKLPSESAVPLLETCPLAIFLLFSLVLRLELFVLKSSHHRCDFSIILSR
jgi:hypothetical protein